MDHGPGLLEPNLSQIWISVRGLGGCTGQALALSTLVDRLIETGAGSFVLEPKRPILEIKKSHQ